MVLEQVFGEKWIERRGWHALILGIIYSIVGIISAKLIFGSNPGLMSVAFTSILLIPSLNMLLSNEENLEIREKKFSIRQLFIDHVDIFETYLYLFLGILIVYAIVALVYPHDQVASLFAPQLKVAGITGNAAMFGQFASILKNNIIVLVVCLVLSLIYGAGSILFITWNASVWGVVFGYFARESAMIQGKSVFVAFGLMMLPILPHMITEAISYFLAAIVGGVMSKATLREKMFSKEFHHIITDGMMLLGIGFMFVILAAYLEVYLYGYFLRFPYVVLVVIIGLLVGMFVSVDIHKRHRHRLAKKQGKIEIFKKNLKDRIFK